MKYRVEIELVKDGKMEKHEYYISDIEDLDKYIPAEAIELLSSLSMNWQIDVLKEEVAEEGYADLGLYSGPSSLEISVKED